jgi:predicted DCC family thiol-disulfide oxidoreductase YuxK
MAGATHTVLYDVDCGFCRWAMAVFLRWDRNRVLRPVAIQDDEGQRLLTGMNTDQRLASWHLATDGRVISAGAALPKLVGLMPGGRVPSLVMAALGPLTRSGYQLIADHREIPGRRLTKAQIEGATQLIRARSAPESMIQDDRVAATCSIAAPASCAA